MGILSEIWGSLQAAQGEMVSLFRDAAKWLEKYAPEEVPPPPVRVRLINAVRTFLGKFFPALKPDDACKQKAVVLKSEEKRISEGSEPPGKVADGETPQCRLVKRAQLKKPKL